MTDKDTADTARGHQGRAAARAAAARRRAQRAVAELEAQGYTVTLTRADEDALHDYAWRDQ